MAQRVMQRLVPPEGGNKELTLTQLTEHLANSEDAPFGEWIKRAHGQAAFRGFDRDGQSDRDFSRFSIHIYMHVEE